MKYVFLRTAEGHNMQEASREKRLRRALHRRGLALVKSRRKDQVEPDYGQYMIINARHVVVSDGYTLSLDDVEQWILHTDLVRKSRMSPVSIDYERIESVLREVEKGDKYPERDRPFRDNQSIGYGPCGLGPSCFFRNDGDKAWNLLFACDPRFEADADPWPFEQRYSAVGNLNQMTEDFEALSKTDFAPFIPNYVEK